MGSIDVWNVETCTEIEAARGRSSQARLTVRHRQVTAAAALLPTESPYRFCDLAWLPRFMHAEGERRTLILYQVQGVDGLPDGVYGAAAPEADLKVILHRWFGELP
jgi:hypothetical protein